MAHAERQGGRGHGVPEARGRGALREVRGEQAQLAEQRVAFGRAQRGGARAHVLHDVIVGHGRGHGRTDVGGRDRVAL